MGLPNTKTTHARGIDSIKPHPGAKSMHRISPPTVADYTFDLNKIDQEIAGKEIFMANQEEILQDVRKEYEHRRHNALENRVLVSDLADLFGKDRSSIHKLVKRLEIPVYFVRTWSEDNDSMQRRSALDKKGALKLAEYYGGGDILDDSTGGQSKDTSPD